MTSSAPLARSRPIHNPTFTAMIVAAIGLAMMVPNPLSFSAIVLVVLADFGARFS